MAAIPTRNTLLIHLNNLYIMAVTSKNISMALKIIDMQARLLCLFNKNSEPQRQLTEMSASELNDLLEQLK